MTTEPVSPTAPPPGATVPPRAERRPPLGQLVNELWTLVVTYLKQETVVPLKNLGRYLGFGIAGAVLVASGVFFVSIGVLRAMQALLDTEVGGDHAADWVSAMPYLITIAFLVLVAALVFVIGTHKKKKGPA